MTTESTLVLLAHRSRIGKFISVGVVGATIETLLVAVLTAGFGIGPTVAKAIGAEISITTMFTINDRWTFVDEGELGVIAFAHRWIQSHLVRVVGLSVAFTILYLLTSILQYSLSIGGIELWPTVANLIGIGVGMSINYVAESLFTWDVVG
ncbi:GtrA family protein [Haloarcula sp. H-GB4]|uniref:GtrA family protein n=1 Tax=Haloarcula sp. H-GB4 TaxID=3069755 RepID=UPI0027B288E3|nr:GtrA family protein [Haloarcula sp. H-GB4]MDQ2072350.1 GtrA family protein [Haloarcula sp. H-GB4]